MKKTLLICMYFLYSITINAQEKIFDLQVVAEGNFGTANGDVFAVSNSSGTISNSGPLYQNANVGTTGFDVLQDFQIVGDKAILLSKANGYRVVVVDYPSFNHIHTFAGNGAPQTIVDAGENKAYVSYNSPNKLKQINLLTNTLTEVNDPNGSINSYSDFMVYAQGYVYVAISSKLVKVDVNSNSVVATIQPGLGSIVGLEYDTVNHSVWVLGNVSGVSALLKIDVANNDNLDAPILLSGISNAGYLRYAKNKLYFLSEKNVYFYDILSPNLPINPIYTSTLDGSWDFAYGKSFYVDPQSSDFVIGSASGFFAASKYEIVDGTSYSLISSGNVPGCIGANEFVLKTTKNLSTENTTASEFTVYPNPASEEINFNFKTKEEYTVNLFNQLGSLVKNATSDFGQVKLNVSSLQRGIYYAQIIEKNEPKHTTVKKIILTR